jgi:hypothetical protein
MGGLAKRFVLAALAGVVSAAWALTPAGAVEDGLLGVRIGASYREITEKFGPPHGIVFPSMIFQTVVGSPMAGLPNFGAPAPTEMPVWVLPIRPASMGATQTQWVYDLRKKQGIALGILLTGEGADAVVTDVVVAGFPQYLKGKPAPVRTAKGIALQSSFEEVLKKYGYPPLIEIYPPSVGGGGGAGQAGRGGAMRAGGGVRGGMRAGGGGRRGGMRAGMRAGMGGARRGGGGRRAGRAAAPGLGTMTARSEFGVVLTGAPGMRGRMGGGMRGRMGGGRAGMRGGARGGGGRLPPLGSAPAGGGADQFTATAVANHQAISFSRDCTMVYEGIAFALHDMKVFRIHVSE